MMYAFDLLELDGEDLREMPLGDRKKRLARLLGRRRIGIRGSALVQQVRGGRSRSP
jgi:ATP-dependent DNA ligase